MTVNVSSFQYTIILPDVEFSVAQALCQVSFELKHFSYYDNRLRILADGR